MSIVDKYGDSDLKFDLETTPWPWSDDSVVTIELCHIWEYWRQQTAVNLSIISELFLIMVSIT